MIKSFFEYIKESVQIPDEIVDSFQELEDDGLEISYKKIEEYEIKNLWLHKNGILLEIPLYVYDKDKHLVKLDKKEFDSIYQKIINLSKRLISYKIEDIILYTTFSYYFNYNHGKSYQIGNDSRISNYKKSSLSEIKTLIENQDKVIKSGPNQGEMVKISNISIYIYPIN
jgi:hypothetical protein